jgi:hypothetical protein
VRGETKSLVATSLLASPSLTSIKVLLTHRISQRRHRGFVVGAVDLEADRASALANAVCRAEKPGHLPMPAGLAGRSGEALQGVGNAQVRLNFGGTCEHVVGVAFGLLPLTLRDRHAGAHRQRRRQVIAGRARDRLVGPAAGHDQIAPRSVSQAPAGSRSTTMTSVAPDSTVWPPWPRSRRRAVRLIVGPA